MRRLRLRASVVLAAMILVGVAITAVLAPYFSPQDPTLLSVQNRLRPPSWIAGGSWEHPLGTDALGRDILSRLIYGARISLIVGIAAVILGGVIGTALGIVAGYRGGWLDDAIMRLADIQMAFPFILLALAVMAVLKPGIRNLVLVLAVGAWVRYARVARAEVLVIRSREFVEAARAMGQRDSRIMLRQVFPNSVAPLIVIATFSMAHTILSESSLSFLGLGVDPATPTWGSILADGRDYLREAWWISTFPGVAIALTVLATNLFGDWLRDRLDPRIRD